MILIKYFYAFILYGLYNEINTIVTNIALHISNYYINILFTLYSTLSIYTFGLLTL
jgi:hypothetical protein